MKIKLIMNLKMIGIIFILLIIMIAGGVASQISGQISEKLFKDVDTTEKMKGLDSLPEPKLTRVEILEFYNRGYTLDDIYIADKLSQVVDKSVGDILKIKGKKTYITEERTEKIDPSKHSLKDNTVKQVSRKQRTRTVVTGVNEKKWEDVQKELKLGGNK